MTQEEFDSYNEKIDTFLVENKNVDALALHFYEKNVNFWITYTQQPHLQNKIGILVYSLVSVHAAYNMFSCHNTDVLHISILMNYVLYFQQYNHPKQT